MQFLLRTNCCLIWYILSKIYGQELKKYRITVILRYFFNKTRFFKIFSTCLYKKYKRYYFLSPLFLWLCNIINRHYLDSFSKFNTDYSIFFQQFQLSKKKYVMFCDSTFLMFKKCKYY